MPLMPSDPDLKRLAWRAHHRGTRKPTCWSAGSSTRTIAAGVADDRATFAAMLEEQDVDIMAWAHGTAEAPERFEGPMIAALKQARLYPDLEVTEPLQRVLRADQPLTLAGVPTGFLPWLAADLARAAHGTGKGGARGRDRRRRSGDARACRDRAVCSRPKSRC